MDRKNTLTNSLPITFLLLLFALTFSQCKKGSDVAPVGDSTGEIEKGLSATGTTGTLVTLDVTKAAHDEGWACSLVVDLGTAGDSPEAPAASKLRFFENGKELGPAHSAHADIRTLGKGRFSHWSGHLYFSSSDNTDPRANGRTYAYTIDGTTGGSTSSLSTPSAPATAPATASGLIGYANVNGTTTGGAGGQTVTVTSYSQLKSATESSATMIIKVSGIISGSGFINVKSNKTIVGTRGSGLEGIGLLIYGTSNIIVQNLITKNVVSYSNIVIKEGAHHIWIDHCDLSSDRSHGWDYYDGLLDVGQGADFVSLSYNKLHDNHVPMLIGFDDGSTGDIGHLRTTIYGNYFYNVSERQPSVRFGTVHVFNNYMSNGSGYGIGATMGAIVRTDNNYFENQNVPIYADFNSKPGFVSGAATNIYKSTGVNKISTAVSTWLPPYQYNSVLIPAASVPAAVTAAAGAILNIS